MLEVQERWYLPNMSSLGWHIGLWNLVGAFGFTLCGALGYGTDRPGVEYASTLSTFVGSWAFLVSPHEWITPRTAMAALLIRIRPQDRKLDTVV